MDTAELKAELLRFIQPSYPDIEITVQPWADDPSRLAISFVDAKFSVLYPMQRYHYLAHLIPKAFSDQHLTNTVWFELAPGEKAEDLQYPDEELIEDITPDVMRVVMLSGVIEKLDDLMCPANADAPRAQCHGDYRHAREVLLSSDFTEDELFDVFHVLMAKGGFCDCEILYNAVETSRLKAEYWLARAENRAPYDPHESA
jgi:Protein of unknown function (DUF2695)